MVRRRRRPRPAFLDFDDRYLTDKEVDELVNWVIKEEENDQSN